MMNTFLNSQLAKHLQRPHDRRLSAY